MDRDFYNPPQGLPPPKQEPATVDEMRQAILRAYRNDHTVHSAFQFADHRGMSGEDRYAMLAYYALRRVHDLHNQVLRFADVMPAQYFPLNGGAGDGS